MRGLNKLLLSTNNKLAVANPLTYLSGPSIPTFNVSAKVLTAGGLGTPGELFTSDLAAGINDAIFSRVWPIGTDLNGLQGVPGKEIRLKNDITIFTSLGSSSATDVLRSTNTPDQLELYGATFQQPLLITGGSGSGLNFSSTSISGTTVRTCNVLYQNLGYAGQLTNLGQGTPDANGWGGYKYRKDINRWTIVDGYSSEGEGFYKGTTHTPYSTTDEAIVVQCSVINKGREGVQITHANKSIVTNCTFRSVGLADPLIAGPGQDNLCQFQDCAKTYIAYCIFDGAPNFINLFTHDTTFYRCYFRWTNGQAGFAGDTSAAGPANFKGSPRLNGVQVLFDDCDFDCTGQTVTNMIQISEVTANYQISNSRIDNGITNLYQDSRGTHTNTLIGTPTTNGNTKKTWTQADRPTYASNTVGDPYYNCVTHTYFYNRGQGFRTPIVGQIDILESYDAPPQNITYGTAFGSITLPSTILFLTQDGYYTSFNVTWSAGSYSATTPGAVTVFATPTFSASYQNRTSVQSAVVLTVGAAPSVHKVVLISCGSATGGLITSGNWNHLRYNNPNGALTAVDSTGANLTSFICTDGTVTGYNFNMTALMSGNTVGQTPGSLYPNIASQCQFYSPTTAGNSRGGKITGLDVTKSYTIKIFSSCASFLTGTQTVDITITGATTSSFATGFNEKGNTTTDQSFTCLPNASGEIAIDVKVNTGTASMNVIELNFDLP